MASPRPLIAWSAATAFAADPAAPGPRLGHVAVPIPAASSAWGDDLVVVHGGLSADKWALGDVCALQAGAGEWARPQPTGPAPPPRAFHAACAVGGMVFIFGGHAWLPAADGTATAAGRVAKFGDLWALDTADWSWSRLTPPVPLSPAAPAARDFCALAPIAGGRLLLFGGLDAADRRLDDAWVFDPATAAASGGLAGWTPLTFPPLAGGGRPKARYGHALLPGDEAGNRVFLFGGETVGGPCAELWTLRGLGAARRPSSSEGGGRASSSGASGGGDAPGPAWIPLDLPGPRPTPRKGCAAAAVGSWLVFWGGRTLDPPAGGGGGLLRRGGAGAERVLGGPPAVMDRVGSVCWCGEEEGGGSGGGGGESGLAPSSSPPPREFASLTPLPGGRLLLLGGGGPGGIVWGDAWVGQPSAALPLVPPPPVRVGGGGGGLGAPAHLGRAGSAGTGGLTPLSGASSEDGGGEGGGRRAPHTHLGGRRPGGRHRGGAAARPWWAASPASPEFLALRRRLGLEGGGPSRLGAPPPPPPLPPPAAGGEEGSSSLTLRAALALLASLQPGAPGFRGGLSDDGAPPRGARFIGVGPEGVRLGEVEDLVMAAAGGQGLE